MRTECAPNCPSKRRPWCGRGGPGRVPDGPGALAARRFVRGHPATPAGADRHTVAQAGRLRDR
ncbi:hypothetical protein ACIQCD_05690 [Streptomyces sp. NPDC093250]|uniref:hypothetical protein n=1 Tax=Streptomyces sp. NPDC093250 TaxID=3366036 RepID=UPI0038272840